MANSDFIPQRLKIKDAGHHANLAGNFRFPASASNNMAGYVTTDDIKVFATANLVVQVNALANNLASNVASLTVQINVVANNLASNVEYLEGLIDGLSSEGWTGKFGNSSANLEANALGIRIVDSENELIVNSSALAISDNSSSFVLTVPSNTDIENGYVLAANGDWVEQTGGGGEWSGFLGNATANLNANGTHIVIANPSESVEIGPGSIIFPGDLSLIDDRIVIGGGTSNVVANATSITLYNEFTTFRVTAPSNTEVENGQYFLGSNSSWVHISQDFLPNANVSNGSISANSSNVVPTQSAVKAYVDDAFEDVAQFVVGPNTSTNNGIATFSGNTGTLLKSEYTFDHDTSLTANSNTAVAPQRAVKTYVDNRVNALEILVGNNYQPLSAELTVLSNVTSSEFGRSVLELSDDQALADVVAGNTASEYGRSLLTVANSSEFANLISGSFQPLDETLTAVANLSATEYGLSLLELSNVASLANEVAGNTATGYGRSLLTVANAEELALDVVGPLEAVFQPLNSDLTAIANLTTTAYGRSLLEVANSVEFAEIVGESFQPLDDTLTDLSGAPTTTYGRSLLNLANLASLISPIQSANVFQPLDTDLTAIAALTTNAFGRNLLTLTSNAGLIAIIDAANVYQPIDADLTAIANLTTTEYGRSLLEVANSSEFAEMVGNSFQPLDADLTAIANISTQEYGRGLLTLASNVSLANEVAAGTSTTYGRSLLRLSGSANIANEAANGTATAYGRSLLTIADANALTAEVVGPLGATYQPLDEDLTAISNLATTEYGRSLLEVANASEFAELISGSFQPLDATLTELSNVATSEYGISLLNAANAANLGLSFTPILDFVYQPIDSDLTSIAALTTTNYGRGLLERASPNNLAEDLAPFYQPLDDDLTAIANLTTTEYGRGLLEIANVSELADLISDSYQPISTDLTAIANLTTQPFGRSLLTYSTANQLANSLISNGFADYFQPVNDTLTDISDANVTAYAITVLEIGNVTALANEIDTANVFQRANSVLDDITALSVEDFGLSLLELANSAGLAGLVSGDYQPADPTLTELANATVNSYGIGVLALTNAASLLGYANAQGNNALLTSIAGLNTSPGFLVQTGGTSFAKRLITAGSNAISVTNGNGVSGDISVDIASSLKTTTLVFEFNSGNTPLPVGHTSDLMIPFGFTAQNFVVLMDANVAGAQFSLWGDAYANYPPTAADNVALMSNGSNVASFTGSANSSYNWVSNSINANTCLRMMVGANPANTITRATIMINGVRS